MNSRIIYDVFTQNTLFLKPVFNRKIEKGCEGLLMTHKLLKNALLQNVDIVLIQQNSCVNNTLKY